MTEHRLPLALDRAERALERIERAVERIGLEAPGAGESGGRDEKLRESVREALGELDRIIADAGRRIDA